LAALWDRRRSEEARREVLNEAARLRFFKRFGKWPQKGKQQFKARDPNDPDAVSPFPPGRSGVPLPPGRLDF
jgi:hypothetical protein